MSGNGSPIVPNVVDEGRRLMGALEAEELAVRLLGGLAIRLIAGESFPAALEREYRDIDLATRERDSRRLAHVLSDQGYEPNKTFNLMHGARRLLFYDEPNGRQLDVFVGTFEMCHTLPIGERLDMVPTTLPGADLLLTKLQIVKLNAKDRTDLYALLLALDVAPHDREAINCAWVARLCARDWGLYRTSQMNLERLRQEIAQAPVGDAERALIVHRVELISQAIEAEPKSSKWKLRARVGDKVRWYEDPEEVDRHGY
jgi:hypothetical protein